MSYLQLIYNEINTILVQNKYIYKNNYLFFGKSIFLSLLFRYTTVISSSTEKVEKRIHKPLDITFILEDTKEQLLVFF